ncbi:MAG: GTPase, partial [Chloroflexota bacterium]|nr:GTPase [Chloroflexota bacterium]
IACYPVSAREGTGLDEMLDGLARAAAEAAAPAAPVLRVYRPEPVGGRIRVQRQGDAFHVTSRRVTSIVARTDLANPDALIHMRSQLAASGLREALVEAGAQAGDTVVVGEDEFLFDPEL